MFKKLRNRLLLVNMIIISALLLGSFAVIYIITYQNIQTSTTENLHQILDFDHRMRMAVPPDTHGRAMHDGGRRIMPPEGTNIDSRADMMAQFVIYTDENGEITEIRSPFEIDLESESIDISKMQSDKRGVISYSGGYWAYLVQKSHNDGYKIGFVDYTSERRILFNLLMILSAVWVAALAAAFIISLSSANKSIRPVEESYNKQKQFVADASHELKTPLTTINTNIDVLLGQGDATAEERKWLSYIKSETERMTKLTNDLLYLARLDHNEDTPVKCTGRFSEAAQSVILTMEAVAFEKNISFNYEIAPQISVLAPEEQLKQIIMILLDNAVKYTPDGGRIDMSLAREKSEAVLRVRNSGEGISEEDMKHIFDRFYRADKSRARESGGYGLGLAIAKSICTSCGGDIYVESEKGKYTEFVVKLRIIHNS